MQYDRKLNWLWLLMLATALAACGFGSTRPDNPEKGYRIASIAKQQLGRPYRYGGLGRKGFDCSGLVHYAHRAAGVRVPRMTRQQYRAARRVALEDLHPGDLLFFRLSGFKVSHVGIYTGGGRFVHAPSSGKRVMVSSLGNDYWRKHLVRGGRLY
jgi:cell wall-associated NlpC family hydrolase